MTTDAKAAAPAKAAKEKTPEQVALDALKRMSNAADRAADAIGQLAEYDDQSADEKRLRIASTRARRLTLDLEEAMYAEDED
jgi:hypothetical protein